MFYYFNDVALVPEIDEIESTFHGLRLNGIGFFWPSTQDLII